MHPHARLIRSFYEAFQAKDAEAMNAWYDTEARFSDPVFPDLNAEQVKAMWSMFCSRSKNLQIEFGDIQANEDQGTARWLALYTFQATGQSVINRIESAFTFREGRILTHTDAFNFYGWARQALGFRGLMLGWTPLVKNKVRDSARRTLEQFIAQSAPSSTQQPGRSPSRS